MKKGRHIFVKALCAVLAFAIIFSVSACQGNSNTEDAQSVTAEPVENGLSAYELAVQYGYEGTVQEWLDSLVGKSAYDIAVENGYSGTEPVSYTHLDVYKRQAYLCYTYIIHQQ